jgi:lysophospholipase L1-like esterase
MTAPSARKRILSLLTGCVAAILLLSAVVAVSHCDRKIASHLHRKFQSPRKAQNAITPVARDLDRHAQFLERRKQGDIDLLFLGDSITDRWPRVGEWSWLKLAAFKPANFGVDGECTENLLWRLENGELDGISPKVVVVLIGTNNLFYFAEEKPEWTARGIEKIVAEIRKRSPMSKVLLLGIFPRGEKDNRLRSAIAEVNRQIQHLDDGAHVRFADIGAQFLDEHGNIPADLMPDKTHPSAKGYAIWYRLLESLLPAMMQ